MKEEERLENQLDRQCWADEPRQWMQYLDEALPEGEMLMMEKHQASCSACTEILTELRDFYSDDLALEDELLLPDDEWYLETTQKHQVSMNVETLAESIAGPIEKIIEGTETVGMTVRSVAPVIFLVCFFLGSLVYLESIRPLETISSGLYPEKNTRIQYLINAGDQLDPLAVAVHEGYEFYRPVDRSSKSGSLLDPSGVIGLLKFSNAPLITTGF